MGNGIKIAIGIPHAGEIPGYFFDTVLALSRPADTSVIRVQNKPIDLARNMIVEGALADPDVTHLFFMDADMQFHPNALLRLAERNVDVVGGTYFARTENPIPHIYRFHHEDGDDGSCPLDWEHDGGTGRWYRPMHKEFARFLKRHKKYANYPGAYVFPATDDSLVKADALGTGSMLIKREVLEALSYPWFKCHEGSAGGEDFYFCDQAQGMGFGIYGDFSVQSTHEFRHMWMDRGDFMHRFKVGQEGEYDFNRTLIVDASPKAMAATVVAK